MRSSSVKSLEKKEFEEKDWLPLDAVTLRAFSNSNLERRLKILRKA
jgi:hypothetical protein